MLDFQYDSRGRARDNKAHARRIREVIDRDSKQFVQDFKVNQLAKIARDSGPARLRGTDYIEAQIWTAHDLSMSKLMAAHRQAEGLYFQHLVRDIGSLSWKVSDEITMLPLTSDQEQLIQDHLEICLLRGWSPTLTKYEAVGLNFVVDWHNAIATAVEHNKPVDSLFIDDDSDTHHLIEVKRSLASLGANSAKAERVNTLAHYFGYRNYLLSQQHPDMTHPDPSRKGKGTPKIDIHLCGVQPDEPNSALRRLFLPEELMGGRDTLRFVTQLADGDKLVYDRLRKWRPVQKEMIQEVVSAIYPIGGQTITDEGDEIEDDGGIGL